MIIFFTGSLANGNTCGSTPSLLPLQDSVCEISYKENKCDVYQSKLISEGKKESIKDLIACGPEEGAIINKGSLSSCGSLGLLIFLQFSKNVFAKSAGGALGMYFVGSALATSIGRDSDCYYDMEFKTKQLNETMNAITELEVSLGIDLTQHKPHRYLGVDGLKRLKHAPCIEMNQYLLEKRTSIRNALQGYSESLLLENSGIDEAIQTITESLANEGIHFRCLNAATKARIFCDALSIGLGVSTLGKALLLKPGNSNYAILEGQMVKEAVLKMTHKRLRTPLPSDITKPTQVGNTQNKVVGDNGSRPTNNPGTSKNLDDEVKVTETLASNGYKVKFRVHDGKAKKNPDIEIEGKIFDIYSPNPSTPVKAIIMTSISKARKGQTDRVVVNLVESPHSINDLRMNFLGNRPDLQGLREVLGITREGQVIRLFP